MISDFGKQMIASGIPADVVERAYKFVDSCPVGSDLVMEDKEFWDKCKDFAAAAYVRGTREAREELIKKALEI